MADEAGPRPAREGRGFDLRTAFGAALLVPAGALALLSPPPFPDGSLAALGFRALAWAAFGAGAALRFWATLYVGGRKVAELVTDGPYSVCRNPLYLGSFLLALSVALFLPSLTFAAAVAVAAALYAGATVPSEERFLAARHGAAWQDYARRVPRFVPRPSLFRSPAVVPVRLDGLALEARRAARWALLPLAGELLRHLRAEAWWPELFRFP